MAPSVARPEWRGTIAHVEHHFDFVADAFAALDALGIGDKRDGEE